jgi:hypothetical protein
LEIVTRSLSETPIPLLSKVARWNLDEEFRIIEFASKTITSPPSEKTHGLDLNDVIDDSALPNDIEVEDDVARARMNDSDRQAHGV